MAQVNIYGQKRFAVRVRVQPDALAARNITLDELTARAARGQRQHAGRHARGPRQTLTLQANRQLRNAAEFAELIVSNRDGNPVRLRDVAAVEDSFETVKTAPRFNGETSITLAVLRQPDANTVQGGRRGARRAARASSAQLPQSVRHHDRSTTARCRSATRCTTSR